METESRAEPWFTDAKLRTWRAPAIVAAVALAAYARVFDYGFSQLDDKKLILEDQAFLTRPASVFESFGRLYFEGKTAGYA